MGGMVGERKHAASEKKLSRDHDYGATIHKRIKLMSHSGSKANTRRETRKREPEPEPAHQTLMHI